MGFYWLVPRWKDMQTATGGLENPAYLGNALRVILDVFEYLLAKHEIKRIRLERQFVRLRVDQADYPI